MLDSSTPGVMDPSAPGVTKQVMLDWLQINHPKSPVSSSINKTDVAVKVRKKQPEFFPDPTSNLPALATRNPDETAQATDGPPILSQPVALKVTAQPKRDASPSSSTKPAKRTNLGNVEPVHELPIISKRKKEKRQQQLSKKLPSLDSGKSSLMERRKIKPTMQEPGLNLMETDSKEDLKALKYYEVAATNGTMNSRVKAFSAPVPGKCNIILPEASKLRDLIDFSDVDLLSVDNLEIEQKVPSVQSSSTSIYKLGVDIFLEERLQAEKVHLLEESVSKILNKINVIEKTSNSNFVQHERQQSQLERSLEENINRLDQQEKCINTLRETVANLKKQMELLHQQCTTAEQAIQTHERCIIKLMELNNSDKDSDSELMNNESAGDDSD